MGRFTGVLGILAVLLAAWLGSTDRRHIRWRTVAWGLSLQFLFAFLVLRFTFGQQAMAWAGDVVNNMLSATAAGTKVLFGALGTPEYFARLDLRIPGAANDHLHFGILCGALSHWRDADHYSRHGVGDAEDDAHLGRREHECCCVDLHGADRSTAYDSAVSYRRPRAAS